jgi:hypothetical protein
MTTQLTGVDERLLQFDHEWREGSRDKARDLARAYIMENEKFLTPILGGKERDELTQEVEKLRNDGRFTDRIVVDMWLIAFFPKQYVKASGTSELPISFSRSGMFNKLMGNN